MISNKSNLFELLHIFSVYYIVITCSLMVLRPLVITYYVNSPINSRITEKFQVSVHTLDC